MEALSEEHARHIIEEIEKSESTWSMEKSGGNTESVTR